MYYEAEENTKVFKEIGTSSVFVSADGYKINRYHVSHNTSCHWSTTSRFEIFAPNGELIDEIKDSDSWVNIQTCEGWEARLYYFETLTGRERDQPVKWAPQHFPQGTVVKISRFSPLMHESDDTYTVNKVFCNEVGSYIIETTKKISEGYFAGDNVTFNICFVGQVIKRGHGEVIVESQRNTPLDVTFIRDENLSHCVIPNEKRTIRTYKDYIYLDDFISLISAKISHSDYTDRYIDRGLLFNRLRAMGFLKKKNNNFTDCHMVKYKPALKHVLKNPHLIFENKKTAKKRLDMEYSAMYDDRDYD